MAVTKAKKGDYVVARKLVFAGTYIPVEWRRSKEKDQECYVVMRALRVGRNGLVKHVVNKQAWEAKHTPGGGNTLMAQYISMTWTLGMYAKCPALENLMDKEFETSAEVIAEIEKAAAI